MPCEPVQQLGELSITQDGRKGEKDTVSIGLRIPWHHYATAPHGPDSDKNTLTGIGRKACATRRLAAHDSTRGVERPLERRGADGVEVHGAGRLVARGRGGRDRDGEVEAVDEGNCIRSGGGESRNGERVNKEGSQQWGGGERKRRQMRYQ